MDENKVKEIIRQELERFSTQNQFAVSKIPAHDHDGVGSLRVDANDLEFGLPYFRLINLTTTPSSFMAGAIASVAGTLYICNGTSWIKVGSQ